MYTMVRLRPLQIVQPDGRDFGMFRSKPVRIISKPSKMRQAAKNLEGAFFLPQDRLPPC